MTVSESSCVVIWCQVKTVKCPSLYFFNNAVENKLILNNFGHNILKKL